MEDFSLQIEEDEILDNYAQENNLKSVKLYDWQRKAIEAFNKSNFKMIIEAATGTGKTTCAIEIIKDVLIKNPELRVLFVVPKNVIMETGWYKELYEAGIELKDIGVYYGNIKEIQKFTITNIQNIHKIALELFDMCVMDEIHNYPTKRGQMLINHPFKYKIGLSATLQRYDKGHIRLLESFNYSTFRYDAREAIDDKVINSFNFCNVGVVMDEESFDEYETLSNELDAIYKIHGSFDKIMKGKNDKIKGLMLKKINDRKQLVNNYYKKFWVVRKICLKHNTEKILVFNQFNEQTNKLYWELIESGVKARVIHSGLKKEENDRTLIDFRNDRFNCLLASKMLDEGYSLPAINVGIIMAGDNSPRQTIQRMGRILRKKKDKSFLYQMYCINTIEEESAKERSKLFKQLCNDYREYTIEKEEEITL